MAARWQFAELCLPMLPLLGLAVDGAAAAVRAELSSSLPSTSLVYSDLPFRDPLRPVLLSFALHWALFLLCPVPAWLQPASASSSSSSASPASSRSPSSAVVRSYAVSTFHAVCACAYVLSWLAVYGMDLQWLARGVGGGVAGSGDELQQPLVCFSLGYFLYDSACMLLHPDTASPAAFLHHAAIGSAFVLGLYFQVCRPFHFLLLLEELSTPPLNLKTLLRQAHPAASDAMAALFALSFIASRMGYGLYVFCLAVMQLLPFLRQAQADGQRLLMLCALYQTAMCSLSRLLNAYWTALILRKLLTALRGGEEKHSGPQRGLRSRLEAEASTGGSSLTTNPAGQDKAD